jgi:NAD(P)-dependent dehydrogenase (short-subunit alcohol dehydrogenase family)
MNSFHDRVAAVTGAASGIGRALSMALAREGCHLALADLDAEGLARTAEAATALGVRVTTQRLDVADRDAVFRWAAETRAAHGAVHLVFNNAGIAAAGTVEDTSIETYTWLMGVNFWGVLHGTQAFLPHLRAAGEGHVINVSSVFGLFAQPSQSAYNASKFAVRGFTESLRQELDLMRCGVSATCVHPGGIRTNIVRAARFDPSTARLFGDEAAAALRRVETLFATESDRAAEVILDAVRRDARRVLIGADAHALSTLQRLLPGAYQALVVLGARMARAWFAR